MTVICPDPTREFHVFQHVAHQTAPEAAMLGGPFFIYRRLELHLPLFKFPCSDLTKKTNQDIWCSLVLKIVDPFGPSTGCADLQLSHCLHVFSNRASLYYLVLGYLCVLHILSFIIFQLILNKTAATIYSKLPRFNWWQNMAK
jgi:hypothetical protein